jgi:Arc/MetJ-type ribon-helix-helix transcriptional regulator
LPPALQRWAEEEAKHGSYSDVSDYIRHLILRAQAETTQEAIEEALLNSGKSRSLTPARWKKMRADTRAKMEAVQRELARPKKRSA